MKITVLITLVFLIGAGCRTVEAAPLASPADTTLGALQISLAELQRDNARANERIAQLADSTRTLTASIASDKTMRISQWLITVYASIMSVSILIMAFITFMSNRQYQESCRAIADSDRRLQALNDTLKRITSETAGYGEFLGVFFNCLVPEERKLNPEQVQFAVDLISWDPRTRFIAIRALAATANASAIPFLDWVVQHSVESRQEALEAIQAIHKRSQDAAAK